MSILSRPLMSKSHVINIRFSFQDNISNLNMRNIWLSGQSMALFVSSLETKSRLTHLIVPYIASDNLLVNQSFVP